MDNNLALAAALRAMADAMVLNAASSAGIPPSVAVAAPAVVEEGAKKVKRKASAYNKRYKAAFKRVSSKYKTKTGTWRKGGFKAAVKEAHRIAGGKKR